LQEGDYKAENVDCFSAKFPKNGPVRADIIGLIQVTPLLDMKCNLRDSPSKQ
jgi:hypothetical protein